MPRIDSTLTTLAVAGVIAGSIVYTVQYLNNSPGGLSALGLTNVSSANAAETTTGGANDGTAAQPALQSQWAATAAGRVEPEGGVIRISPERAGVVTDVLVEVGDRVKKGDLLFKLKDDEVAARWAAARTEIDVRKRERSEDIVDDEKLKKAAEPRTKAEDALGDAELATYTAQRKLDDAYIAWRQDGGPAANVETARKALEDARKAEAEKRAALETEKAKEGTPLPTRLEGGLEAARDDLAVLEVNMQRTRVRAPRDGTILDVSARVGETITPSPQAPAVELGNLETLIIRSELEERDLTAVEKGQKVIVRSNAFPGRDFEGQVRLVAPSLSAPKLSGRGPRAASDVDVVEVEIALEGQPPLIPGMRVDVFFKPTTTAEASGSSGQPAKPTN